MGTLIIYSVIGTFATFAFFRPWVGIVSYYFLALLGPQFIWWWDFKDIPASLYIALPTLAGLAVKMLKSDCDLSFLRTRQNAIVLLIWIFILISFWFGPFVEQNNYFDASELLGKATKIYFFYFCATLLINKINQLYYLTLVILLTVVYYIYWGNLQYLTGNWTQFNMGRLMGPVSVGGFGIYGDENGFAMLFVTGIPFIYYFALMFKNRIMRCLTLCLVPLGWHAVFLTGSRGGLLGLGVVTAFILFNLKNKSLLLLLIPFFVSFYFWQAGNTMKDRSETISDYHGEASAETRLEAWKNGIMMLRDHPVTGVGLGSFMTAFPLYSDFKPQMTHNTVIQFAAESGIGAGLCYLLVIRIFFKKARNNMRAIALRDANLITEKLSFINNASTVSFAGLVVCSLFLSLNYFEIFFYLLILNNTLSVLLSATDTFIGDVSPALA